MDFEYLIENWREVVGLGVDHLRLSLGAVAVALLIAVPVGVLAARFRRLTLPILSLLGLLSYKVGRSIAWDGEKEQIIDDPAANRFLRRKYRGKWQYPEA